MNKIVLAIHGGAGSDPPTGMTQQLKADYHHALGEATSRGYSVLEKGGTAIDAAEASLRYIEDCYLFNAGRGSSFTEKGTHEMDAAIMCGKTLRAGAVAAVRYVKNPVTLARTVMENAKHLFIVGRGAENIARETGIELMPDDYFYAEHKYVQWKNEQAREAIGMRAKDHGTAGAVALDSYGNLAAATSTGGLTNKMEYRVSDSALIGAGTYADNASCAVSCSGDGEYFIRTVAAHEIASLVRHCRMSVEEACFSVLREKLDPFGGDAGIMALDAKGNLSYAFNTPRFYRGWRCSDGSSGTAIYRQE
jgi:L-asparaginase / beta-aspartyl-peptidase